MNHPAFASNHVAVVTGAASGIGLAAAKRFAGLGMTVVLADLPGERLDEAARQTAAVSPHGPASAVAIPTDVADAGSLEALERETVSRFGAVHVLMNNAGIQPGSSLFGPSEKLGKGAGRKPLGRDQRQPDFRAGDGGARAGRSDHQYRLQAGHHHAARRSRL